MTRCSVRNRYCMAHMDRFAGNSGALAMPLFRARWSIWLYWGKSAPLKRTPSGSWSPRTPRAGYVLGARTPHEFFRIYRWTEYRAPYKKLENWSSLDFLLGNGCVLHEIEYNDSRSSCFPVNLSLPSMLLIFLLVVTVLLLYLWYSAYSLCILVYFMHVYASVRYSLSDDTECRDPVYCIAHTMSTRSISPVGIQYTGIYFQRYSQYTV